MSQAANFKFQFHRNTSLIVKIIILISMIMPLLVQMSKFQKVSESFIFDINNLVLTTLFCTNHTNYIF